ncbi:elongation factor 1-beta [Candidatus Woesearchaeota archaeon]|nr:elongation factor 1-beta [Candidatus Woesearchaeota archaeon]
MARVIITLKLMMDSPEASLSQAEKKAREVVASLNGEVGKVEIEPIAFGLSALKVMVVADESIGSDPFEEKLKTVPHVASATVVDYRRALG